VSGVTVPSCIPRMADAGIGIDSMGAAVLRAVQPAHSAEEGHLERQL
jgi:hypothetical protein